MKTYENPSSHVDLKKTPAIRSKNKEYKQNIRQMNKLEMNAKYG